MCEVPALNTAPALDLQADPEFAAHFTLWQRLPRKEAVFAEFPRGLDPRLPEVLRRRGVSHLYSHQAESIEAVIQGQNVVVVTPTASGKTLCYNLPVLNAILDDPEARALYLFPTKALAQDQLRRAARPGRRRGRRHQDVHLRRRHGARRAAGRARGRATS